VRVFKYGNGWIHATLNMNKPVGDLTIDDDSDICTRANELELIGVKKKEKGKVKGKETAGGQGEEDEGAGAGGNGKRRELLGRWRGGGSQLVRQQVH